MMDTMGIITMGRKGKHLNTSERYHIYKTSRKNLHMNDTHINTHNPIFGVLQEIDTKQQYTPSTPPSTTTQYKFDRLHTPDSHNIHLERNSNM
jgi:hypothetical protein